MRLIDADALIEDLKEHKIPFNADVNEAIIVAPTIDAVEVIRCKDCKHRLHLQETSCHPEQYLCRLDKRTFYPSRKANNPEWFCADGERKTDDNDN